MPVFNLTIPDTSPLIVYANGLWHDSSHDDSDWDLYENGTFHATQDNGATASLTFNGSAVYVYGAKRTNHGQYLATFDGVSTVEDGSTTTDEFNVLLFNQKGLGTGQHQLTLTNQWTSSTSTWVDIDYMYITSGDGNPDTASLDVTMDDGDQNITYSSGWDSSPNGLEQNYYDQTMHRTQIQGATADINFYGNAITVYGATSSNHGLFSVSLDGIPISSNLNGSAPPGYTRWQNMLYYSGGLSTALHKLTIANVDPTGLYFDLDKVVVSTWPVITSPKTSSTTSSSATSSATSSSSHVNTAAIVGSVVPSVVVVAAVILGLWFFIRRRQKRSHNYGGDINLSDSEEAYVQPFIVEPDTPPPNTPHVRTISQSQTSWSTPVTTPYTDDTSKMTTFTSVTETENPHTDFPPPDYEQATAASSSRRE